MAGVKVTITVPAYCTDAELWEILMAAYDKELDRILESGKEVPVTWRPVADRLSIEVQFRDKTVFLTTPITDPARLLGPGVEPKTVE